MRIIDLTGQGVVPDLQHEQSLVWIEKGEEPVLALGRLYPAGLRVPAHFHNRTQLWSARRGVVLVMTAQGRWMIPPGHGLLIPAGLVHSAEMISEVEMHSIYVHPSAVRADGLRVVEVTVLARSLMETLVRMDTTPLSSRRARLVMELLLDEIGQLPERPLGLPFPDDQRLAQLCRQFVKNPAATVGIDDWARDIGMSRRSFTRFFRAQTGLSFVTWRQQACLFASLPRLADGEPITNVALDAGYENMAAFTTMFRRMLGSSPSIWLKARAA